MVVVRSLFPRATYQWGTEKEAIDAHGRGRIGRLGLFVPGEQRPEDDVESKRDNRKSGTFQDLNAR